MSILLLLAINGSHRETARALSEYAEGDLQGYKRWRVTRHLGRCEACRTLYRTFLATVDSLRGLGREDPPADPDFASRAVDRARDAGRDDAG